MKKLILLSIVLAGCTDATWSNWAALGEPGTVNCYSGGKIIYEGRSTGKIQTVQNSDGWEFKDAETGKFVRVSGDCLVEN